MSPLISRPPRARDDVREDFSDTLPLAVWDRTPSQPPASVPTLTRSIAPLRPPRSLGRLMHLSNLHFGTEDPAAVSALLALGAQLQPEVAVISGDLTQRATAVQFEAAAAFWRAFDARHKHSVPGHHDMPLWAFWERLGRPLARYERALGLRPGQPAQVLDLPWLRLVLVDSVRPWRQRRGELDDAQLARSAQALQRAQPGQLRVLVLHHPLMVPPAPAHGVPQATTPAVQTVDQAEAAARRWAAAGADLVLGGHVRQPFVESLKTRWPGLARPVWAVQAGRALSRRAQGGPAPSVYEIEAFVATDAAQAASGLGATTWAEVRRWDFDAASARFQPAGESRLALAPR